MSWRYISRVTTTYASMGLNLPATSWNFARDHVESLLSTPSPTPQWHARLVNTSLGIQGQTGEQGSHWNLWVYGICDDGSPTVKLWIVEPLSVPARYAATLHQWPAVSSTVLLTGCQHDRWSCGYICLWWLCSLNELTFAPQHSLEDKLLLLGAPATPAFIALLHFCVQ